MKFDLLFEDRKNLFTRTNGDYSRGFYSSKRASVPFLVVFSQGDNDFKTVSLTPQGKKTLELARKRSSLAIDPDVADVLTRYAIAQDDSFENFPEIFIAQRHDRKDFFKALIGKYKISPAHAEHFYGEAPEADDAIDHNGATIIPKPGMNATSLKLVKENLSMLSTNLDPLGLHDLYAGVYRITDLGGKTTALYHPTQDMISLDIKGLRRGYALRTLTHEVGHRWEKMPRMMEEYIIPKYKEVVAAGHDYTSELNISTGDIVHINRRNYKGIDWTVTGFDNSHVELIGDLPDGRQASVKLNKTGMLKDPSITLAGEPFTSSNDNPWFVTDYAKTNVSEWFAELFASYATGRNDDPDVDAWFKSIPRP